MNSCGVDLQPPRLPTWMTRAAGFAMASTSSLARSSARITSAAWSAFTAFSVSSSGSPGPAPTRMTLPGLMRRASPRRCPAPLARRARAAPARTSRNSCRIACAPAARPAARQRCRSPGRAWRRSRPRSRRSTGRRCVPRARSPQGGFAEGMRSRRRISPTGFAGCEPVLQPFAARELVRSAREAHGDDAIVANADAPGAAAARVVVAQDVGRIEAEHARRGARSRPRTARNRVRRADEHGRVARVPWGSRSGRRRHPAARASRSSVATSAPGASDANADEPPGERDAGDLHRGVLELRLVRHRDRTRDW